MISSIVAGFSLLMMLAVANTYIRYLLFADMENQPSKHNW